MKKFYISLVSLMVVVGAIISLNVLGGTANATDRWCNTNSIIRCGALTADELNQKYNANVTGDLSAIYNHYGVSSGMVANVGTAKNGQVGKNGQVVVDGKVIATDAQSTGRNYVAGSTSVKINGKTIYQRATQSVFVDEWDPAFVFQKADGTFLTAIIQSCGNPVVATPVPPVPPTPPVPAYTCTGLSVTPISRTQFSFTATKTIQNVSYVRTDFIVRDSTGTEIHRANSTQDTYVYDQQKVGAYTMEAQIIVSINGQESATPVGVCKKPFEVKEIPVVPVYGCTSLQKITKSRDTYEFKTVALAEGGAIAKTVSVDFGDGNNQTVTYGTNASHTYIPGNYTATATVGFTVEGKEVSKSGTACLVAVTIEQPPVVPPVTPVATPEVPVELPTTGPVDAIAPLFGLGSMIASAGYYIASRRASIGL